MSIEPTVPLVAEIELSPAFHDLDPMDVVWHGHTLKYLELARCALLQGIDYDYPQMRASGYAGPAIVIEDAQSPFDPTLVPASMPLRRLQRPLDMHRLFEAVAAALPGRG